MPVELVGLGVVGLVEPVRRDTVLRGAVHFLGADLHFEEVPAGPEDRGVERLVAVRLGAGDVVLEALLQRSPAVVNDPQDVIALRHARHDHPHRHHVVDLFQRGAAPLHLGRDRPEMLGPAGHLEVGHVGAAELALQRDPERPDHLLPLGAPRGQLVGQAAVFLRLQELEGEVLELRLDARHAEAVGQRRVDLPGLERDPAAPLGGEMLQRPHVVEPVGELDDDDPRVAWRWRAAASGSSRPAPRRWTGRSGARSWSGRRPARRPRCRTPWPGRRGRPRCPPPRRAAGPRRWRSCRGAGSAGWWRRRCEWETNSSPLMRFCPRCAVTLNRSARSISSRSSRSRCFSSAARNSAGISVRVGGEAILKANTGEGRQATGEGTPRSGARRQMTLVR